MSKIFYIRLVGVEIFGYLIFRWMFLETCSHVPINLAREQQAI